MALEIASFTVNWRKMRPVEIKLPFPNDLTIAEKPACRIFVSYTKKLSCALAEKMIISEILVKYH